MPAELIDKIHQISTWVLPVIFGITLHEAAHGYAAYRFGDDTAYRMGRLSLNPLRHIDPFGTILMPLLLYFAGGVLFGYAKPVPVQFQRLRNPRWHMVWVAAAGPGANIFLALVSGFLLHLTPYLPVYAGEWAVQNLQHSIILNIWLAIFNLIPIPPLDGGRIAVGLLPRDLARAYAKIEPYGIFIVLFIIFILPLLLQDIDVFGWILGPIYRYLMQSVISITGLG